MYLRCPDCLATPSVDHLLGKEIVDSECADCGRRFRIQPGKLGNTPREHYLRAKEYADGHELDIASAYSVLLGVMTPDQAAVLQEYMVVEAPALAVPAEEPRGTEWTPDEASPAAPRRVEPPAAEEKPASAAAPPDVAAPRIEMPDAVTPATPSRPQRVDPGMERAVDEGWVTPSEARSQGSRQAFAARLRRRYGLSADLAAQVANNELTLHGALLIHAAARRNRPVPSKRSRLPKIALMATFAFFAVAVVLGMRNSHMEPPNPPPAPEPVQAEAAPAEDAQPETEADGTAAAALQAPEMPAGVETKTDASGQLVEVIGPDPATVLRAFCASVAGEYRPVAIMQTDPPSAHHRIGILRDYQSLESYFGIRIQKDYRTHRWAAGTGYNPVPVRPTPPPPEGALPVS